MQTSAVTELNAQFAIPERLAFLNGPGDLPLAEITNQYGSARIALQGGQVVAFHPHGEEPVLFVSRSAVYAPGKSIRGGIPICWPWFGPHPTDASKPQHGFVRTMLWQVKSTQVLQGDATQLQLGLMDTEVTRALWPYPFELLLSVTLGPELLVDLVANNPGSEAFTCGSALHSYFRVSDVADIAIDGITGCTYIDKNAGGERKQQQGPVTINGETDRIYLDTAGACVINDAQWHRRIHIDKAGSRSTVIWNPWAAGARRMADFGDEEYRGMVCVETANAGPDVVTVPPGGQHRLRTSIRVERE